MVQGKIAVEIDTDIVTARALARAIYFIVSAVAFEGAQVVVDGFQMNKTDGWRGDYRITIERRS